MGTQWGAHPVPRHPRAAAPAATAGAQGGHLPLSACACCVHAGSHLIVVCHATPIRIVHGSRAWRLPPLPRCYSTGAAAAVPVTGAAAGAARTPRGRWRCCSAEDRRLIVRGVGPQVARASPWAVALPQAGGPRPSWSVLAHHALGCPGGWASPHWGWLGGRRRGARVERSACEGPRAAAALLSFPGAQISTMPTMLPSPTLYAGRCSLCRHRRAGAWGATDKERAGGFGCTHGQRGGGGVGVLRRPALC